MKKLFIKPMLMQLFVAALVLCNFNAHAQKTTIWIVRHAEKADTPANNPALTTIGQQRAKELLKSFKHDKIAAIYTTNYLRTAQTAQPTASQFAVTQQTYNPADLKAFAAKVLQDNAGKNVLIVGHSNTVVPTLAALGCTTPFNTLTDDDYDILFKVTVKNGKASLEMSYYGTPHHSTQLPEQAIHELNPVPHPVGNF